MEYESVIGLEVHVQMKTASKLFCPCRAAFGREANTLVCPVCTGQPGALPVLNEEAFRLGIQAALALNCTVAKQIRFDRKNYFYPDLPKGYQITQLALPLGTGGSIEFENADGRPRRVAVRRVHVEEDAGKAIHRAESDRSLVDLNRAGIPLLEIVSEPWAGTPAEARACLESLKQLMRYTGISDCDMEKGSLRCDANLSVRHRGETDLGTRTEVKNLNSFRNVEKALLFEKTRQRRILDAGGSIEQETRHWRDAEAVTAVMRTKEEARDYRYFPDPDLPLFSVSDRLLAECASRLPERPRVRRQRFIDEFGLSDHHARVLTAARDIADYFEESVAAGADPVDGAKWIEGPLLEELNRRGCSLGGLDFPPSRLADLAALVTSGELSRLSATRLLPRLIDSGREPADLVSEMGLRQISDEKPIEEMVRRAIADHTAMAEQYSQGKNSVLNALVGQVMKASMGKADPRKVRAILRKILRP